ncbi:hypothetical protein F3Y22_tig00110896pilonHSYRG00015 [Hibiscus syriacus]|uniref:non-specific serine/threonine protein kinase n=1 Tax=Hibiscus syriacus TaxID=106335 RepID=A0A6A2ZEK9_HIBSY|nr:hypothetical protein F3Y22_tig00110896pilonHSYRG00015 [Hibiscus syriacus]
MKRSSMWRACASKRAFRIRVLCAILTPVAKVLKKADVIRKNAVESILADRNILISVRNPFVVRFFYSFTCREIFTWSEYLNGGDLYSLRNLGCLDEDMVRVYIAEVVPALEYLHSLNVIHRDLKPTVDRFWALKGATADWWSVGIILFDLLLIFDNIVNRNIPWPKIPEEMSYEAYDLIDKLLTENPVQRLGATGASEAMFIPSTEAHDTSYFMSRYAEDEQAHGSSDLDDLTDTCSGSLSNVQDEDNLSQLASINYDLVVKNAKESAEGPNPLSHNRFSKCVCNPIFVHLFSRVSFISHAIVFHLQSLDEQNFFFPEKFRTTLMWLNTGSSRKRSS